MLRFRCPALKRLQPWRRCIRGRHRCAARATLPAQRSRCSGWGMKLSFGSLHKRVHLQPQQREEEVQALPIGRTNDRCIQVRQAHLLYIKTLSRLCFRPLV